MKYLKVIGIIGAISLWVFFSARSDYKWADLIVEQETSKGWAIAYRQDNFADLTLPWTWIKTPVTGLWFINDTHTQKINSEIYLIHTLRVSYDYSKTDKEESLELVNVKTRESVFLDTEQDLSALSANKLKWHKYDPGTPGDQIIQYVVKKYEKNG
uniref:Uncharacterized protein n=1 Tax=Candidatus Kentrum sp. FW TaxID=2126338 RepID=A0A450U4M4_9GAMM|nr:MAG: hypothetical protein BECKFW1821C_GA0114237_12084 [Candidatus Kentron sp. FW]